MCNEKIDSPLLDKLNTTSTTQCKQTYNLGPIKLNDVIINKTKVLLSQAYVTYTPGPS